MICILAIGLVLMFFPPQECRSESFPEACQHDEQLRNLNYV